MGGTAVIADPSGAPTGLGGWRWPRLPRIRDPRPFQIATLGLFALLSQAWSDFGAPPTAIAAAVLTALAVEWLGSRSLGRRFDPQSPLITALSLSILLRANDWWVHGLAALVGVGAKFVLRVDGKHVFNPANLAIACCLGLSWLGGPGAWVSPGQWGSEALVSFAACSAAILVLARAGSAEVAAYFLVCFVALLAGRLIWLSDPSFVPVLLHKLQSGALLIFTFYMITDPRTVPDSRAGRVVFAGAVAVIGWWLIALSWVQTGLIWALVLVSAMTPLIDRLLPDPRRRAALKQRLRPA